MASLGKGAREILEEELPRGFVERRADENAWNAHVTSATAYRITGRSEFLETFEAIASELERRERREGSLPRSREFPWESPG